MNNYSYLHWTNTIVQLLLLVKIIFSKNIWYYLNVYLKCMMIYPEKKKLSDISPELL